ncbi:transporter [Polynucleobacter sp. 71A-WALBACH]|nr:transporter [Polynucleobacter sp. 71A-WALBACH]
MRRHCWRFALWTFTFACIIVMSLSIAQAQNLEPRSYANTPIGLNFLIAGYAYTEGKVAFNPTLPIANAQFHSNTEVLAYVRSIDAFGNSAKFDVILPYSAFYGDALANGQPVQRQMSGIGDPKFRFSMNFYGAPALSLKDFRGYSQDLIIGASMQISAPLGQYDNSKLINLGYNRWSFRPELGISKAIGSWTLEFMPSVTFYTVNSDFNYGQSLSQAPQYEAQAHIIYSFVSGVWLALNGDYFVGNRTTLNGVLNNNLQSNTRAGITLALPVDRHNSVKLYASTGTASLTGSNFNAIGIAWQYRWGDGY